MLSLRIHGYYVERLAGIPIFGMSEGAGGFGEKSQPEVFSHLNTGEGSFRFNADYSITDFDTGRKGVSIRLLQLAGRSINGKPIKVTSHPLWCG